MLFRPADIPFATDDAHKFLPWLIGVMAGLAAILLCLGVSVNGWTAARAGTVTGSFTVTIPAGDSQAAAVARVKEALGKIPGIAKVSDIDSAALKAMLKPWLGEAQDDLPLPALLDVTLKSQAAKVDYPGLQKNLAMVAPGVEVDAHERWTNAFAEFSSALRGVSVLLAALIVGAMTMLMVFVSRTALKLHSKTVLLLHAIGAEDGYILRQFQQESVRLVLPAALLGSVAAALIYWAAGLYMSALNISLLPPLAMTWMHALLLLGLPLAYALGAWVLARVSLSLQLQRIL